MTNLPRATRQLLRDWQSAGLTHLPRAAPLPESARPKTDFRSLDRSERARSEKQTASPPRNFQKPVPPRETPAAAPVHFPATNLSENTDPLPVRTEKLTQLAGCVANCVRCPELASTRTQTVFGVGNSQARVMFIGEAPGADEDRIGEPFVGKAGQLLTKIVQACGWQRDDIYICNVLRCRPPGNRTPNETEAGNCREYLDGQIAIIDPEYIVCWGACAAQNLLGTKDPIGRLREKFFQHGRAKVLCTYHPSYLLRNPAAKKPVWEDMKFLLADMGLTPPG